MRVTNEELARSVKAISDRLLDFIDYVEREGYGGSYPYTSEDLGRAHDVLVALAKGDKLTIASA
jgi:hypothetical protein